MWPSARVAASIAFSVPMTDTNGKRTSAPRSRPGRGREVVAVAVLDLGAERPHRVDVQVDRPPPDAVAARVADDHPTEPSKQRAEQHERGTHLGSRLEGHELPLDVARGDLVHVLGSGWSTTTPSSMSVWAMTRTSSISGTLVIRQRSPVSVAAASILSAAFLAPLIATRPGQRPPALDRGRPPASRARARTPSGTAAHQPRVLPRSSRGRVMARRPRARERAQPALRERPRAAGNAARARQRGDPI